MEVTTKFRRVVIAVFVMVNSCVALFPGDGRAGDGRAGGRRAGGGASGSGESSTTKTTEQSGRKSAGGAGAGSGSPSEARDISSEDIVKLLEGEKFYDIECLLSKAKPEELGRLLSQIQAQSPYGHSLLHVAVYKGAEDFIKYLLGVDRNYSQIQDNNRNTALYIAVQQAQVDIVKLLLSRGADMDAATLLRQKSYALALERCGRAEKYQKELPDRFEKYKQICELFKMRAPLLSGVFTAAAE